MAFTEEQRMEVYQSLPEELKRLYSSQEAAALNGSVIAKFSLSEAQAAHFLEISGDVVLGFNKITDMPRLFQQRLGLGADQAQRVTSQLIDFLEPIVRREEQEATMKKEELAQLARTFAKPENLTGTPSASSTQSASPAVEPIRTMEGDINRVHGYGAYVEARYEAPEEPSETAESVIPRKDDTQRG